MNASSAETDSSPPQRTGYAQYVCLAIALAVFVCCVSFVVRVAFNARHDIECQRNLTNIHLALQQYHERCGSYPPAYVQNEQGERWHSWRVLLLPDLGYPELYAQYRFDEPWNSPHNSSLLPRMPAVYGCPADRKRAVGHTNYFAIVGPQTAWPEYCALHEKQVRDGPEYTIFLMESVDEGIAWMEPRDLDYAELRKGGYESNPRRWFWHTAAMRLLFMDGTIETRKRDLKASTFRALCTPATGKLFPGVDWQLPPPGADEIRTTPQLASELLNTTILPHLRTPIVAGKNAVYCGNFQIAWDRLRSEVLQGPVELEGDPEMARELNRQQFPQDSLADDACVAMAGQLSDGILDKIRSQMEAKFPTATSQLLSEAEQWGSVGIVAFAYLQKRLPFALDFDRLKEPLHFHGVDGEVEVACFGIEDFDSHDPREDDLRDQVDVLDYVGPDDFVLQLQPTHDTIVLAKVPRANTLGEALATVQTRISQPLGRNVKKYLDTEEQLVIPLLTLYVRRTYTELTARKLLNPGFSKLPLVEAIQLIRFQLDESGAILDAEAALGYFNGDEDPPAPRRFVFDRPFLIYLQQQNATQPYFVMWVENVEVLVPW